MVNCNSKQRSCCQNLVLTLKVTQVVWRVKNVADARPAYTTINVLFQWPYCALPNAAFKTFALTSVARTYPARTKQDSHREILKCITTAHCFRTTAN